MPRGVYFRTDQNRENLSKSLTGRKLSEEHKAKLRSRGSNPGSFKAGMKPWNAGTRKPKPVRLDAPRSFSDERKLKLSLALSGRPKSPEWRKKLAESLRGRSHSPERIQAIITGVIKSRKQTRGMTKPELRLADLLLSMYGQYSPYQFTGDRRFWVSIPDGNPRNPDFTNTFDRKIIEVFGRYWHRNDSVDLVVEGYRKAGWECMVLWEDQLGPCAIDKIHKFTDPWDFECEWREANRI